jgi:hypothetical protein
MISLLGSVCFAADEAKPPRQPGGGPRGGGFMQGGADGMLLPLQLLRSEKVQKEIELMDDQKAKINDISKEAMEGFRKEMQKRAAEMGALSEQDRNAKMAEFFKEAAKRAEEIQKKLDDVLLPQQTERLKEIALQVRGRNALADAKIQKELGFTDAQVQKYKDIFTGIQEKVTEIIKDRDLTPTERRAKMEKIGKDVEKEVDGILTQEQTAKFEKMKGQKFQIDWREMMPQRPRGQQPKQSAEGASKKAEEPKN